MLNNIRRLSFSYLTHIIHPRFHPKITGDILRNKQKNKRAFIHEITSLITMKMKMEMKNKSHR